jgi:uncharacterized protein YkwD
MAQKSKRPLHKVVKHEHMRKKLHALRLFCFGVLAVGLLVIQFTAHIQQQPAAKKQVLAYATAVSINTLYASTNQARAANGLGALSLNAQLNSGAQAKANDMIAKDYWSHVSPDGTQPWAFFTAAGYSYQRAGENLAYGFDTSQQIIDAWMNSSGHRANLLGAYSNVGFGIASGPNYQGGENTVVVSFYGQPLAAPAPAPAPATTAPKQTTSATPRIQATPAPTPAPAPTPEPVATQPTPHTIVATVEQPKKITNLESLLGGNANWAVYASLGLVGMTTVGFAGTHWQLVRREWKYSRHFILVHPALDTAVISGVVALILTATAGHIN